ncbi:MAG: DoxX family protein [Chloroflexi bacterium]|nr:DoxX family protein [Chloroflexota bacterium]
MAIDLTLLVLRLVVGGLFIGHGAQKLFGWFGGYGFAGTRGFMGNALRLRPAGLWTALAGLSEFGGGLLFAVGLLSPLGPLGIIAAMLMAILLLHWGRLWVTENGMEYPLVALTAAAAVALSGPGAYSLDAALGIALPAPATFIAGLVAVLAGTLTALATRAPATSDVTAPGSTT